MKPVLTRAILLAAIYLVCVVSFLVPAVSAQGSKTVTVAIETSAGTIDVEVDPVHAPITTANFLRYVDAGLYNNGRFHRAVRLDNQVRSDVRIEVIQGGRGPESVKASRDFAPVVLERTSTTGLRHVDGTISMARDAATDSATSDFFLCVGAQPSLDFGGKRAADGQGFAAFGHVVSGMDVVRMIQAGRTNDREQFLDPVVITRIYRR